MSIVKDSVKTAVFSKPMAFLLVLVAVFFAMVGYLFGYFFTYKETVVSVTPVQINVMKVKKQNTDSKYNVYYRYTDKEITYVIKLTSCVIKPKIEGTVLKGEQVRYTYTTMFNKGEETRLSKPNELFCVQK